MFQLRLYGTPVLINVNIFIIFNTQNKGQHICVRKYTSSYLFTYPSDNETEQQWHSHLQHMA